MLGNKEKLIITPHSTATRKWLLETVSKTIAKELLLDDDQSFLFDLMGRIKDEYKRLANGSELDW